MAIDYLKKILTAKVYDVAQETDLQPAPSLSARIGNRVYLKREDNQPVFSFKLRGAYNKMASLTPAERKRGVITASAGNHAQGVAFSAARLGCKAVITMPVTTPQLKIDGVRCAAASGSRSCCTAKAIRMRTTTPPSCRRSTATPSSTRSTIRR